MSTKHMVQTRKHSAHPVPSRRHPAHTVQDRKASSGALRPFESLGPVFEDFMELPFADETVMNALPIDIRETDKTVEVAVALPGVDKKDIKLDLTAETLSISCERREETDETRGGAYRLREQSYGRFYRSFTLPAEVKTGDAKAVYKNGVLKVTLQKQKPDRTRQITVE